jgi:cytoskeletal protein CcmA (bactofilin family)
MKIQNIIITSSFSAFIVTGIVQAVEVNIYSGEDVSGEVVRSNTVTEGQVIINGKVVKGASRRMTPEEQRQLNQELNREENKIERDMDNMEQEMEGMFD